MKTYKVERRIVSASSITSRCEIFVRLFILRLKGFVSSATLSAANEVYMALMVLDSFDPTAADTSFFPLGLRLLRVFRVGGGANVST
jgi:hypothetical protein